MNARPGNATQGNGGAHSPQPPGDLLTYRGQLSQLALPPLGSKVEWARNILQYYPDLNITTQRL